MTLLTVISDPEYGAAVLCGLPNPTTVVGSNDPNAPTLLRLANQEGRTLARRHDWQGLITSYTVPTLAAQLQTALPTDFDHFVPYVELWNRSINQKYKGPTDALNWNRLQSMAITSGQPGWWRMIGNAIYLYPAPTAGQTIAFDYISKKWAQSAGAVNQTAFLADSDIARIPEHLITLGIIWRYASSKGFDYAEDMATYEREVELACSRDRGTQVISVSKSVGEMQFPTWPGTITP